MFRHYISLLIIDCLVDYKRTNVQTYIIDISTDTSGVRFDAPPARNLRKFFFIKIASRPFLEIAPRCRRRRRRRRRSARSRDQMRSLRGKIAFLEVPSSARDRPCDAGTTQRFSLSESVAYHDHVVRSFLFTMAREFHVSPSCAASPYPCVTGLLKSRL